MKSESKILVVVLLYQEKQMAVTMTTEEISSLAGATGRALVKKMGTVEYMKREYSGLMCPLAVL